MRTMFTVVLVFVSLGLAYMLAVGALQR